MKGIRELLISETLVVLIILVNAAALTVMGFTQANGYPNPMLHDSAELVDKACVVYFVLEMALKIGGGGWKDYWAKGWNRFDFIVVWLSVPALLPSTSIIAAFSIMRLGRLFRLFRLMRFIPNREHLMKGVRRALKASVGVFIGLCLVNFIFSIGATNLFAKHAPEYFGDPAISSYSIFRVFSIEGWYEIPDAIANAQGATMWDGVMARLYFMTAMLVGGILGVGLANAIFVDEMTMDNTDDMEKKVDTLLEEVRDLKTLLEQSK